MAPLLQHVGRRHTLDLVVDEDEYAPPLIHEDEYNPPSLGGRAGTCWTWWS